MLATYAVPIEFSSLLFPVVAALLVLPVCLVHYRYFGRVLVVRALVFYAFAYYLLTVFFLTALPLPELTADFCARHRSTSAPQLTPFGFIGEIRAYTARHGLQLSVTGILHHFAIMQVVYNVVMFVPLGIFLRYLYRTSLLRLVVIAFAGSLFLEITQYTALWGLYPCPYRLFDVDDLWLNTGGAILGYAVFPWLWFLPELSRRGQSGPAARFYLARRVIAFGLDLLSVHLLVLIAHALSGGLPPLVYAAAYPIAAVIWFVILPQALRGRTAGKLIFGLRLVAVDGAAAGVFRTVLRYLILIGVPEAVLAAAQALSGRGFDGPADRWLSALSLAVIAVLGVAHIVPLLRREDRRGLHDLIAGTRVANTDPRNPGAVPQEDPDRGGLPG